MLGCRVFRTPEPQEAHARRRDEILDAAEHCFVQGGFHRTTMQNIASAAGMSVGNLYRYFTSKDAVVEALIARDQSKIAENFDRLDTDEPMQAFAALLRHQLLERGRDKAVLWLEISAEAARNPVVAEVARAHKAVITAHLATFFARVLAERQRRGAFPAIDAQTLSTLVMTLLSGLTVTQASAADSTAFDAKVDHVLAIVLAAVDGRIPFSQTAVASAGACA